MCVDRAFTGTRATRVELAFFFGGTPKFHPDRACSAYQPCRANIQSPTSNIFFLGGLPTRQLSSSSSGESPTLPEPKTLSPQLDVQQLLQLAQTALRRGAPRCAVLCHMMAGCLQPGELGAEADAYSVAMHPPRRRPQGRPTPPPLLTLNPPGAGSFQQPDGRRMSGL